jgi:hypothetical protein
VKDKAPKSRAARRPRKKATADFTSDLPTPSSEWDVQAPSTQAPFSSHPQFTDPFLPSESYNMMPPPQQEQKTSMSQPASVKGPPVLQTPKQGTSNAKDAENRWDETTAFVALQQAIQSSPARVLGAHTSPVEVGDELSPKPTRRLLFPSPRKTGEFKSLDEDPGQKSSTTSPSAQPFSPAKPTPVQDDQEVELVDKENLPPPDENDDDDNDFAHLFDNTVIPVTPGKITPNTARSIANFLRTPTPLKSRTPRTGSKRSAHDHLESPTRTRVRLTPSSGATNGNGTSATPLKPMTPFTASLTQFLSDGLVASSPSKAFHWGLRNTPNSKTGGFHFGSSDHDVFSSDYPGLPSSPPLLSGDHLEGGFAADLGFQLFEDGTATEGLAGGWGDGFFGSGDVGLEDGGVVEGHNGKTDGGDRRSSSAGDIDFAAILEDGQCA